MYFEQAQAKLSLPPVSIEKDFWVCWTLWKLFTLPKWKAHLTFKGGTSLSKAWSLIERFSEDIDIVVDRDFLGFSGEQSPKETQSRKQRSLRIKKLKDECRNRIHFDLKPALEQCFRDAFPTGTKWSLDIASHEEDPDEQTLLFQYPGTLTDNVRYIRTQVKIELGARSDTWPTETPIITSYLAKAFPVIFSIADFTVNAVAPERTFWEKAMLLHEETFRPSDKPRKARLARHYYDLWCLIKKGIAERAIQSPDLFDGVAEHRAIFFNQSWVDYSTLQKGLLRLIPRDEQYATWRQDYQAMQGEMFFGEVPDFDEIISVVRDFEISFNKK